MRRSYISPEYQNKFISGTFNMLEESTFFGAKMLEVEDLINIDTTDIVYYQTNENEQLNISIESSLGSYVYSSTIDKKENHTLSIDNTQTKYQLDNNTRWVIDINLKNILTNYLFATLKKYRTFEGLKNDSNIYKNVDIAIDNYINLNILDRYKFKNIELFVNYIDLRGQGVLKYNNIWNSDINNSFITKKIQTQLEFDKSSIKVTFSQERPSSSYKFEYYFNIIFEKI